MRKICFLIIGLIISIAVNAQSFTGSYKMNVESVKYKKTMAMKVSIKGEKSCLEIISEPGAGKFRSIFNTKEQTMTILTEKEGANKYAMVRKMPDEAGLADREAKNAKITVTDEAKIIDGYTCKKVFAQSDSIKTEMWITQDLKLTYHDVFSMLNRGNGPAANMVLKMKNYKGIEGAPLEITTTDMKNPDDITHITLKEIRTGSVDNSAFDTYGYQIMDMRNQGGQ